MIHVVKENPKKCIITTIDIGQLITTEDQVHLIRRKKLRLKMYGEDLVHDPVPDRLDPVKYVLTIRTLVHSPEH
jgi:hypothetical protein